MRDNIRYSAVQEHTILQCVIIKQSARRQHHMQDSCAFDNPAFEKKASPSVPTRSSRS